MVFKPLQLSRRVFLSCLKTNWSRHKTCFSILSKDKFVSPQDLFSRVFLSCLKTNWSDHKTRFSILKTKLFHHKTRFLVCFSILSKDTFVSRHNNVFCILYFIRPSLHTDRGRDVAAYGAPRCWWHKKPTQKEKERKKKGGGGGDGREGGGGVRKNVCWHRVIYKVKPGVVISTISLWIQMLGEGPQRQVEVKTKARLETGRHFRNQGHCYSTLPKQKTKKRVRL